MDTKRRNLSYGFGAFLIFLLFWYFGSRVYALNQLLENDDSPRMIEAQKALASVQYKAKTIIEEQPEVSSVKWKLDERWSNGNGVSVY